MVENWRNDVPAFVPDVILVFCIIYFFYMKVPLHPWMETCGSVHIYACTCSLLAWILESLGALQVAACLLSLLSAFPASDLTD